VSLSSAISRQSPCNLQALNSGGETPAQIAGASGHFELRDKLTAAESQPVAARHAMGLETGAPAATNSGAATHGASRMLSPSPNLPPLRTTTVKGGSLNGLTPLPMPSLPAPTYGAE